MPGKHTDTFAPADYTFTDAYDEDGSDNPDTHLGYSFNDSKHRGKPAHREFGTWIPRSPAIWITGKDW